ncbi:DNA mismatch repair protein MSH3 [Crepidotus variabilis]|uniref:DNA mismatch repair protein MSH3 n=1 Tax=Crepidotus variabilis TaxID=179855 RepID=A0A9P6EQZ2_9AGAR|nr:DNA mismatch repair protein MSH3 [Crepidotus variabilis]
MPSKGGRPQPTISAFFQPSPEKSKKRGSSYIDLTIEDDDEAGPSSAKRVKLANNEGFQGGSSSQVPQGTQAQHTTAVAEQWRFTGVDAGPSQPKTAAELARHEAFKRKLLSDNSRFLKTEENEDGDPMDVDEEEDEDESEDEAPKNDDERFAQLESLFAHKPKGKGKAVVPLARSKKAVKIGPKGKPYTPLELQVVDLKAATPGTLLLIQVGYKYKFYGDDAKVAAKELGMVAYPDRNFMVASIPLERRDIHMKNLLSHGHRVGIVAQIETAALKKIGTNRNKVFERKLTHLYTAATYIDELDSVDDTEKFHAPPFMCLVEERKSGNSADVSFGLVSVCPSTGDIVWDDFVDSVMRIELETRLVHTRPAEFLLPKDLMSDETEKMITHFTKFSNDGLPVRTERFTRTMDYTDAFEAVSEFYTDESKFGAASEGFKTGQLMASVTDLPKRVVIALAHAIKYLAAFGLADVLLETKFFTKFASRTHMLLAANTLSNLEIYRNETDGNVKGSLIWVLDKTKTKFGARLLRSWVGRPLIDKRVLQDRIDAVEEILESSSEKLITLRNIIKGLPDLAKGLCRIQYGQCTPKELAVLLPAFNKIAIAFDEIDPEDPESVGLKSHVLNGIISALPRLKQPAQRLLNAVNLKQAAENKKGHMWNDSERYPAITDADMALQAIEIELNDELKKVRKKLRMPSLQWKRDYILPSNDYLVEVQNRDKRPIPDDWILISKTRSHARYRPPAIQAKFEERSVHLEIFEAESDKAYREFLAEISREYYGILRDAVNKIATADCLLSLAHVALQENYVRPEFTDDDALEIVDGKHPMVVVYSDHPYVANSVQMGGNEARCKIITGPNMGGKSSCVRMIALIAVMAQIGSYVPATSVKMSVMDTILTRMGASDDLARGRSTFMVEMSETSEILHTATNRSLVILDELGRGTSTFDGMAIADATLQYLVTEKKCKTLFITHYPLVANKLSKKYPAQVENVHMNYDADQAIDGTRRITFLYRLVPGLATESFGIECGRLARIPEPVLSVASEKAAHMQEEVQARIRRNRLVMKFTFLKVIQRHLDYSGQHNSCECVCQAMVSKRR